MGPLRIPHVGRGLGAACSVISVSRPAFLSTSSLNISPRPYFLLRGQIVAQRHYSSTPRLLKMSSTEVRKYLQQNHERIFEGNKKWAEEMKKKNPDFFKNLEAGQSPDYLWIGESAM